MSTTRRQIRPGAYYDSVVLMQLQRALAGLEGVQDAGVVMATPANRALLAGELLPDEAVEAGSDDLLIVVRADDGAAADDALAQVDELLRRRRSAGQSDGFRPRSLASAAKMLPEARWVLISTPGRYAAGVAREALALDKHVFLYSDNVSLEDEVSLKRMAGERGLLLMGPDCGTAVVNGIGLGFANRVRKGGIGIIGASGTGLQAVMSGVHQLGGGISQALGVGGRDLSPEVGGATTFQALDLLAGDPQTEVIVLVSKPPDSEVAARLLGAAQGCGKPVVACFLGYPLAARRLGNLHFAFNLRDAADQALVLDPALDYDASFTEGGRGGYLRGLFSGGTLAYETLLALQNVLHPLFSNVPLRPSQRLPDPTRSQAHTILDLGEDAFTQGRLHPMMDNDLRLRRLRQEAADPNVAMIVLDVVLGQGAHPDPASELAPAIAATLDEAHGRPLTIAVLLVGTEDDPQGMAGQAERLEAAGAMVVFDTAELAEQVARTLAPGGETAPSTAPGYVSGHAVAGPPVELGHGLSAINVGLESFYDSVTGQGGTAVHVDWRPPAGGDEKMINLLASLKGK